MIRCRGTGRSFLLVTSALVAALSVVPARADPSWLGDTSTDWATESNWSTNTSPIDTEIVTIDAGPPGDQPQLEAAGAASAVNISAGSLTLGNNGDLKIGDGAGLLSVSGTGALVIQTGGTLGGVADVATGATASNAGTIEDGLVVSGGTVTNAGVINRTSGGDTVVVTDGGLTLEAGSDVQDTGAVSVTGGTLTVNADDTVATLSQTGGVIDGTVALGVTGLTQSGGDLQCTVVASGSVALQGGTVSGALSGPATAVVTAGTTTVTGSIANAAVSVDSGILDVTGAGTLTGTALDVANGASVSTDGSALAAGTGIANAGTFTITGDETIGHLSGAGDVLVTGSTLNTGDAADATFSGNVSGAGAMTKLGTGTFTLSGNNTITTLNAQDGTLRLTGDNTGVTNLTVGFAGNDARLRLESDLAAGGTGGQITTLGSVVSYGDGVTNATPIVINSNTTQLEVMGTDSAEQSGVISQTGGVRPVEKIGTGTLTLSAANTYTGATTVSAGTLAVTGTLQSAAIVVGSGATFTTDSSALTAATTVDTAGAFAVSAGTETVASVNQTGGTVDGAVTTGAFTQSGGDMAGALTATGASALNGGTISGTLDGGATGAATVAGAATTISGTVTNLASFDVNGTAGTTLADLTGTGTLDTAANAVTVTTGTLRTDGDAIADDEAVSVGADGTLAVTGNETIASLSGAGTAELSNGIGDTTLTTGGNNADTTFAGVISGNGNLAKVGTGTMTLSGVNSVTGTITVTDGTLVNSGTTPGAIINNAVLTNTGTAGAVTTASGASGTNSGTIASLANAGTFDSNGTITGDVSNSDAFTNTGAIGGNIVNTAGATINTGDISGTVTLSGGTFDQNSGGSVAMGTTTTAAGTMTNAGSLAAVNNAGSFTNESGGTAGDVTNSGIFTNDGGASSGVVASSGSYTNNGTSGAVTNSGSGVNNATIGSLANTAGNFVNGGTVTGNVTISGGSVTQTGQFNGADTTVSGGTLNQSGTIAGNLAITGAGTVNASGGTVAGTTTNTAGTLNVDGGTFGGGIANISGALTAKGAVLADITNAGTMSVTAPASLALTGVLRNSDTGVLASTGTLGVSGGVVNAGLVQAQGALNAGVTNGGRFVVTGPLSATGQSFSNSGTLDFGPGSFTGLAALSNTGTVSGDGGTLSATTILNSGNFTARNATLTGAVTNASGTFDLSGGTQTGPASNAAQFILSGGTVSGMFTNTGTLLALGTTRVGGLDNTGGTVDMRGTGTGDVLAISGGALTGGTFRLSSDLSNGTADLIDARAATVSGNVNLQFANSGFGYVGAPVTVLDASNQGYTFSSSGLPAGGVLVYSLVRNGDDLQIVSQTSPGVGGIAANTALVQSLIGTVVNRPSSPFVSGLASEEGCSTGGYARGTVGKASISGTSENGVSTQVTELSASYQGVQGGYDFGCNDGRFFGGWDGSFGVLVGHNSGRTSQPVLASDGSGGTFATSITQSEFDQDYGGVYAAFSKDRLTTDVQLRVERSNFRLSEIALLRDSSGNPVGGLGLTPGVSEFGTTSVNATGRVSYRMDLGKSGVNLIPTAGLSYTHTGGSTLNFLGGQQLRVDSFDSMIGFAGATLAKSTIAKAGNAGTTYFVSGNYYNDFAGNRTSTFVQVGSPDQNITSQGLGGFGELSLGINYVRILADNRTGVKQVNANIRADTRFGHNVKDSASLTAQIRLSF